MNGVNISFFKTVFPRKRMEKVDRSQLWFSFEELSWVNYSGWIVGSEQWKQMCHRIFLLSEQRVFLLFAVWFIFLFFFFQFENTLLCFWQLKGDRHNWCQILWQNVGVCGTQNPNTVETNQLLKMHYRKLCRSWIFRNSPQRTAIENQNISY